MTTIKPISRPSGTSVTVPAMARLVFGAAVGAGLVVMTGFVVLACFTMPGSIDDKLVSDLEARIAASGRPTATCGRDGVVTSNEPGNCHDFRGFRVVAGTPVRVFSLRYDKPLFVFGIENGITFTNEKIPPALLESEKSSFVGYVRSPND